MLLLPPIKRRGILAARWVAGLAGGFSEWWTVSIRGAFGLRIRGAGIGVVAAGWGDGL